MIYLDAPWCGHCKALAPEYSAAAKKLKDKGSLVKLAKVDATVEEELAFKHGVKGYPTLKFFRNEQPIDFGGERDSDAIVNWCLRKSKPPVEYIESLDSCKQFIDKATIAILGFIKVIKRLLSLLFRIRTPWIWQISKKWPTS